MKGHAVIAVCGICATLTGCGGSESPMTQRDVEQQGRQWIKAEAKKNVSVAATTCFEDPDPRHWRCATDLHRTAGQTTHITYTATCDADSCQYKIVFRA